MSTRAVSAILEIDAAAFGRALGRKPMVFRHSLVGDPRLTIGAIAELADGWPAAWLEHHGGDLPLLLPFGDPPVRLDLGAGDVIRQMADNRCWAALWFTERVSAYENVLDSCLDQILPVAEQADDVMGRRGANIFVASPHAVSPAHFDRHHNVLLQVEGTKEINIGVFEDPKRAQAEIEGHYGRSRNLSQLPEHVTTFRLQPGEGIYIPPYAFHWVRGGADTSVAFSCGFVSRSSERAEVVNMCNVRLRKLGLQPKPPGASSLRDGAKVGLVRGRRALNRGRKTVADLRARRVARGSA
jgi:hypothetical protein